MSQRNIIIAVVALLALAGVGYFFFAGPSENTGLQPAAGNNNPTATSSQTSLNSEVILGQLNRLRAITLDTEFLASSQFLELENFGIQINEQPTGRNNPFIPALNQSPATVIDRPLSANFATSSDSQPAVENTSPQTPTNFPEDNSQQTSAPTSSPTPSPSPTPFPEPAQ